MHLTFLTLSFLATTILAQNSTAAIGTNCAIISNHTVIAGDNLANIGTATNTSVAQLLLVNPQIANARLIAVGDVISIPTSACVAPAAVALAEPTATCSNGTEATTTVVAGDSMIIIAKEKLGITLPALVAANPQVVDTSKLEVGDVLNVPLCSAGGNGTTSASGAAGGKNETVPASSMKKGRALRLARRSLGSFQGPWR